MPEPVSSNEIEEVVRDIAEPGWSRRGLLLGAGVGAAGVALSTAPAALGETSHPDSSQEVINVASTIEVLTTVVTTTALQKGVVPSAGIDTVSAASREELVHYNVLTKEFGGKPATHSVWIPDAVFASPSALFGRLVVGEQICINLYLVATTIWAAEGNARLARAGAELVGNEAVHRALARQALDLQPNDRAFMKYSQPEPARGPGQGLPGFTDANGAIKQFEGAGFGFGKKGASPGAFYDFTAVIKNTPNPSFVNTRTPE